MVHGALTQYLCKNNLTFVNMSVKLSFFEKIEKLYFKSKNTAIMISQCLKWTLGTVCILGE